MGSRRDPDPKLIFSIRFTKPLYWWEKGGRDCGRLRRFGDSDTKDQLRISNRLCVAEALYSVKMNKKEVIYSVLSNWDIKIWTVSILSPSFTMGAQKEDLKLMIGHHIMKKSQIYLVLDVIVRVLLMNFSEIFFLVARCHSRVLQRLLLSLKKGCLM